MVDGGPEGAPPVKRKRGRPRKADILAAAAAAGAADGSIISAVNGVPPAPNLVVAPVVGTPVVAAPVVAAPVHAAVPVLAAAPVPAAPVGKPEPKPRKSRKKKGEVTGPVGVDTNLVGKTVTGVLDGSFDAGYILTVRVGDSETILRGVVFGPGLTLPLSKNNDVAPGIKVVKRDENMVLPASSPISVLASPGPNPTGAFPSQGAAGVPLVATTLHVTPTSAAKTPIAPAALSVPTAAATDSNSQPSRGQDSVQPYPIPVPQSHGPAAP